MIKAYIKNNVLAKAKTNLDNNFPWIYSSDVDTIEGNVTSGGIVKVYDHNENYLATGYINLQSKILIRILSTKDVDINQAFIDNRIQCAYNLRGDLYQNQIKEEMFAYRLVFSEADYLPGIVVDSYDNYLVIASTTAGSEKLLPLVINSLHTILKPKGILVRNDEAVRIKEGLELTKYYVGSEFNPIVTIKENGCLLKVDLYNGQKTGYFLDQKQNRALVQQMAKDKTVLDLFSHTGAFSLNAIRGGAKSATAVDISKLACEMIEENAKLNGFDNIEAVCKDIMEYLPELVNQNKKYDIVILDPPAFTKTNSTVNQAYNGYKKINKLALNLVKDQGYLFTFSCSRYMEEELFFQMLKEAAATIHKKIQIIAKTHQAYDHPMLLASDNSLYLKCFVLRITND